MVSVQVTRLMHFCCMCFYKYFVCLESDHLSSNTVLDDGEQDTKGEGTKPKILYYSYLLLTTQH